MLTQLHHPLCCFDLIARGAGIITKVSIHLYTYPALSQLRFSKTPCYIQLTNHHKHLVYRDYPEIYKQTTQFFFLGFSFIELHVSLYITST